MNKTPKVNSWNSINLYTFTDKSSIPIENFDVAYHLERDGNTEDFTNVRNTFIDFIRNPIVVPFWWHQLDDICKWPFLLGQPMLFSIIIVYLQSPTILRNTFKFETVVAYEDQILMEQVVLVKPQTWQLVYPLVSTLTSA